ncbi:MAG: M48 family metallopeptidase [Bacteroidales bacterium]|jgi:heat shock protein HtpX|nr:M48 family metallopeptidase [Bacteroidales bacterium]
MKYIGLQQQQAKNNFKSTLLLFLFPCLVIVLFAIFCFLFTFLTRYSDESAEVVHYTETVSETAISLFISYSPLVFGAVLIWFLIAFFSNTAIINHATGSHSLTRMENKRIYNLVENLCMSQGMTMPKINVIEDDSLNAFASGINKKSYTVTLTRGIMNKLNDKELEGVIAHELTHIKNHDVRTLIISIVFVGIFSLIAQMALRIAFHSGVRSKKDDKGGGALIIIIVLILAAVGYFFSVLMRFAISRQREFLADAGAVEMTKRPDALAMALRKISSDPVIEIVQREDIAQLFIYHPMAANGKKNVNFFNNLFATHPPIEQRIEFLENL